jgi:cyclase
VSERTEIVVVPTGSANIASITAALERAGGRCVLCSDAARIATAPRVVLPGVGAMGAAMAHLHSVGLVEALTESARAAQRDPSGARGFLGICLGLQLLFEKSEESPGVPGLGLLRGSVDLMRSTPRVPYFGWSNVEWLGEGAYVGAGSAYFAHSYRVRLAQLPPTTVNNSADVMAAGHDGEGFIAAYSQGGLLACQFHPELSGMWGEDLLRAWIMGTRAAHHQHNTSQRSNISTLTSQPPPRRVIPCLDVKDGRVVKGVKFANLRDAGDPAEQAARYARDGADELVMLDVSATVEGRAAALETVRRIRREISIPLAVGGGVRTLEDAGALLDAGADKVGVNSAAVADPQLVTSLADRFGAQCVVLAVDAKRNPGTQSQWDVRTRAGSTSAGLDAVAWAAKGAQLGAGEILLTSMDRDGTGGGYDLDLLRSVSAAVKVPVIASGGASNPQDLAYALEAGADAVLAASIFHDGVWTVQGVKRELATRGVAVRL